VQTKLNEELTYIHEQVLVSLRQIGYTDAVIIVEDLYIVSWQLMGAKFMTLIDEAHTKSTQLLQQLRGLKFLVDTNKDKLNQDPFFVEFLGFKMDMAQSFIEELQNWEELGNQRKCKDTLDAALFFLGEITVLIDRKFDEHCEEVWFDYQRELGSTDSVFAPM
jgi:hypothetical protein